MPILPIDDIDDDDTTTMSFNSVGEAWAYLARLAQEGDSDLLEAIESLDEHGNLGTDRWAKIGNSYRPSGSTVRSLKPGVYDINSDQQGLVFSSIGSRNDSLIRFPGAVVTQVVEQIQTFWEREQVFARYELPFRRGILLYGPPGSGKSSTIRLVCEDVVKRGGVVLLYDTHPNTFQAGYRYFRRTQPNTPAVVVMEDLDAIFKQWNESAVLNMLDGVESVHKTVFLATTNYMENLGERVTNRPSRFDRRYMVGHPMPEVRRMYLESLLREDDTIPDIDRWVKDTHGLSLSHLKELFVGVIVMGSEYEEVIAAMKEMTEARNSAMDKDEFAPVRRGQYA